MSTLSPTAKLRNSGGTALTMAAFSGPLFRNTRNIARKAAA